MIKQDFSVKVLKNKIKHNIYPLNTTFGAILQEMIVKNDDEVQNTLS
jgi:hypothetical protein